MSRTITAYHGGPQPIRKFSPRHGAQGLMWFSEDRAKIVRGESGAQSTRYLMTVELKVDKVAGWKEYDDLLLAQIFSPTYGFDAIRLDHGSDGADWALRDSKRVRVISVEERPAGGWPVGRTAGSSDDEEEDFSNLDPSLRALFDQDHYFIAGDRGDEGRLGAWVVLSAPGNKYLAAWIDEDGVRKTAERVHLKSAIKLAKESWGR